MIADIQPASGAPGIRDTTMYFDAQFVDAM